MKNESTFLSRKLLLITGGLLLVIIFHLFGTSVYREWAHGSLFVWLHCVWKFESIGAINYSFSYLIPLVAIWFIWRERDTLRRITWQNYYPALILMAILLLLHGVALRAQLPHLSALVFIGLLWSLATALGGREVGKVLLFPAFYLTLALPLNFIERATFPLRQIAATISAVILNGLNMHVVRVGTAICSADGSFKLDVADPCSGIRSIMALLALGAAYAKLSRLNTVGKSVLFASCIPIAIVANIIRIIMLTLAAKFFGVQIIATLYHEVSGYIVFIAAVMLLPMVEYTLRKWFPASPATDNKGRQTARTPVADQPVGKKFSFTLLAILLLAIPYSMKMERVTTLSIAPIKMQLPEKVGDWQGERIFYSTDPSVTRFFRQSEIKEDGKCPEGGAPLAAASLPERIGLPADTTIIKSVYDHPSGGEILVTIVLSGETRGSIHKPQWCIAAQGYKVRTTEFPAYRDKGDKKVALLVLDRPHARNLSFFCYWFIGSRYSTPYHTSRVIHMAFERLIKGHATRWAYVSISGPMTPHIKSLLPDFVRNLEAQLQQGEQQSGAQ